MATWWGERQRSWDSRLSLRGKGNRLFVFLSQPPSMSLLLKHHLIGSLVSKIKQERAACRRAPSHPPCFLHGAFGAHSGTGHIPNPPPGSQAAILICACESGRPQHLVRVMLARRVVGIFLLRPLEPSSCLEKRFCLTPFLASEAPKGVINREPRRDFNRAAA